MRDEPQTRLDEFDADEWFEVALVNRPDLTREAFDAEWAEFQALKARKARQ